MHFILQPSRWLWNGEKFCLQGCIALCCPCCTIVPAHFLLQCSHVFGSPVVCALCLLPEHLGGCSALVWKTPHIRTQMWAYAECVCNKYTALPRGHLPRIDPMSKDDAIRPHLMVLMCEMAISQIKQQPGNCSWLLTQRSHTEKRYERHVKKLWPSWVWQSQKLPHQHQHLCPCQSIVPELTGGTCVQLAGEKTAALW